MMMKKDNLSEALGIDFEPSKEESTEVVLQSENEIEPVDDIQEHLPTDPSKSAINGMPEEIQYDYALSRVTYHKLISGGTKAVDDLTRIAKLSESPRAYEVLAALIQTISQTTKDLYDLQKKTKELKSLPHDPKLKERSDITVDKAVFVGSTTELLKRHKRDKNENL